MKDISLVNEKKRDVVNSVCKIAENTSIVKRLIVFGSSVQKECQNDSDIDICFDITCDTKDLRLFNLRASINQVCDYNCDFLVYSHIGNELKNEIDEKGVVVYES